MMDTFSRPICDFLRFYMNSVSSAYFFLDCLRLFQSKKISSPTNFSDAEMGVNVVYFLKTEAK